MQLVVQCRYIAWITDKMVAITGSQLSSPAPLPDLCFHCLVVTCSFIVSRDRDIAYMYIIYILFCESITKLMVFASYRPALSFASLREVSVLKYR